MIQSSKRLTRRSLVAGCLIAVAATGCQTMVETPEFEDALDSRDLPVLGSAEEYVDAQGQIGNTCPDLDGNGVADCLEECPRILTHDSDPFGNSIAAGQRLEHVYAAWGVQLVADSSTNAAIAFDSSNPTGGDPDLGTPNERFGGPGVGSGGSSNSSPLGNLVILAERLNDGDNDGLVDNPDDDARGGSLQYDFIEPMCVFGLDLVDLESSESATILLEKWDGSMVALNGAGLGNNSVEHFTTDECGIVSMHVNMNGSGAIDNLELCPGGGEEVCDGLDNDLDGETDEGFGDSDNDGIADCVDVELCDGLDNDGDGQTDENFGDSDQDGIADCMDTEECDGLDNNGDGITDEGFGDADGDGLADCIDTETCDGVDNNGDGVTDEGFGDSDSDGIADCIDDEVCDGQDNDGDGITDEGFTDTDGDGTADCVDAEECDGQDNDGDGSIDEGYPDTNGNGVADCVDECTDVEIDWDCTEVTAGACKAISNIHLLFEDGSEERIEYNDESGTQTASGSGANAGKTIVTAWVKVGNNASGDCPGCGERFDQSDIDSDGTPDCADAEECNGVDDDGDGQVDEGFTDTDGDGIADCVDTETCDGIDNNGNAETDEGFSDTDGDGTADCVDTEECDGRDNDGDGETDEGYPDTDHDGVADCVDTEECDGVDNDGDGDIDEGFTDTDGDGVADCQDVEECDGLDNNGDGQIDEGYADTDGDGTADCIDTEECDGLDNDGDGETDEGYADSDHDGVADCVDTEECDGLDNNGDGMTDEGFGDSDNDGTADCIDTEECDGHDNDGDGITDEGFGDSDGDGTADCIDTEECDGHDNDGDGVTDEGFGDSDSDGVADCVDTEECDGLDNNGDGLADEGFGDSDSDGIADCLDFEECDGLDNNGDGEIDEGLVGTTYLWNRTSGFNNNGGMTQALEATFNEDTGLLSFQAEIDHLSNRTADGFTVAINNGPNPKGHAELALLYFDATGAEPVLTAYAYNGANNFSAYYDGSSAAGTQPADRIASSIADDSFVVDMWADDDGTTATMGFVIDASVIIDHNPLYTANYPWYGIGFGDNMGIWFHNKADLTTSYTNGWLSSWGYGAQGWLDASNLVTTSEENECPDECEVSDTMWSYYGAVADESYTGGSGHAFTFPNLYGDGTVKMEMLNDAVALINADGDIELMGTAVVYANGGGSGVIGSEWTVEARFEHRGTGVDGEGPNGPKLELLAGFQPTTVTDMWDYYDMTEAELTQVMGVGSMELVGVDAYPVQVGFTANGKNQNFGMSSWFTWERFIAKIYQSAGIGDINVDLDGAEECPDDGPDDDFPPPPAG